MKIVWSKGILPSEQLEGECLELKIKQLIDCSRSTQEDDFLLLYESAKYTNGICIQKKFAKELSDICRVNDPSDINEGIFIYGLFHSGKAVALLDKEASCRVKQPIQKVYPKRSAKPEEEKQIIYDEKPAKPKTKRIQIKKKSTSNQIVKNTVEEKPLLRIENLPKSMPSYQDDTIQFDYNGNWMVLPYYAIKDFREEYGSILSGRICKSAYLKDILPKLYTPQKTRYDGKSDALLSGEYDGRYFVIKMISTGLHPQLKEIRLLEKKNA
jgi:hypothetical protein